MHGHFVEDIICDEDDKVDVYIPERFKNNFFLHEIAENYDNFKFTELKLT